MIADTTFIIDLGKGDSRAFKKLNELKAQKEALAITAVTTFELFQGCGYLSEKEFRIFSKLIGAAMVIPVEHETAQLAGLIKSKLERKGILIEALDCLIAGIVLLRKDALLTRNIKDFSRIEGLRLETY